MILNRLILLLAFTVCLFPLFNDHINAGKGGVMAFHKVYMNYQSLNAINVKQIYRTGYHFQPKQNWINGISSSFSSFFFLIQRNVKKINNNNYLLTELFTTVYIFLNINQTFQTDEINWLPVFPSFIVECYPWIIYSQMNLLIKCM